MAIRSFRSEPLADLWTTGRTRRIDARLHGRILRRLDQLDASTRPEDMNLPGFDFHGLQGFEPPRYSVHVNGPWCLTFAFEEGDAVDVDFQQYHRERVQETWSRARPGTRGKRSWSRFGGRKFIEPAPVRRLAVIGARRKTMPVPRDPNRCPIHPGAVIREDILPALPHSKTAIARMLGISRQHLYDIIDERKPVTPNVAVRLGKLFGNGPGVWLRMQAAHDEWHALRTVDTSGIPTLERV